MKTKHIIGTLFFCSLILSLPSIGLADISFDNGFWSTSFECSARTITSPGTNVCSGLDVADRYTADGTHDTQISESANNPAGRGGLGYRHWIGTSRNNHSSYFRARFPTPQKEIWVRWYQRWQPGFNWSAQWAHKIIYMWSNAGSWFYFMNPYTPGTGMNYDTTGWLFNGHSDDYAILRNNSGGWSSTQDGLTGNGSWDCYEIYMKVNDVQGVNNGILRTWVNGRLVHEANYDFLGHSSSGNGEIVHVDIGQNHDTAINSSPYYEDFDDIAIALPGYTGFTTDSNGNRMIGPLGSGTPDNGGSITIEPPPEVRIN